MSSSFNVKVLTKSSLRRKALKLMNLTIYLPAVTSLLKHLRNQNFKMMMSELVFYTGLPSFDFLMTAFNLISPHVSRHSSCLTKFEKFVMVLMKLRLNMPFKDLAYRFKNISDSSISSTFSAWMIAMDIRLSPLILWPEREALWATMRLSFQYSFGKKKQ